MGIPSIVFEVAGLAFSAYSAFSQSKSQQNNYEYQAAVQRNNAQIAKWQADDALRRGNEAAAEQQRKTRLMAGNQTATLAARGLDLNSGSAWNTLSDTELFGAIDEATIKSNAKKQAWSFEVQANSDMTNARAYDNAASDISPVKSAAGTLLGGAGAVADSWYKLNPSTPASAPSYGGASNGLKLSQAQVDPFWK